MTATDPFASAPDEAQAPPVAEEPRTVGTVKVAVKPDFQGFNDSKVVLTFKGGKGFDAPWIVIHATDLQDAHDQVHGDNAVLLSNLMAQVHKAGSHFSGSAPVDPNAGAVAQSPSAPPRGATEPPPGSPPSPGPGWVYRSKFSEKTGKVWHAWMPPQGDDVSKPVFFKP